MRRLATRVLAPFSIIATFSVISCSSPEPPAVVFEGNAAETIAVECNWRESRRLTMRITNLTPVRYPGCTFTLRAFDQDGVKTYDNCIVTAIGPNETVKESQPILANEHVVKLVIGLP